MLFGGLWWLWLIETSSLYVVLVIWKCLELILDGCGTPNNMTQLLSNQNGQNPTFTFPWNNDRNKIAPGVTLGHLSILWSHLLAQNPLSMCCLEKLSLWAFRESCQLTTDPPTTPLGWVKIVKIWLWPKCCLEASDGSGWLKLRHYMLYWSSGSVWSWFWMDVEPLTIRHNFCQTKTANIPLLLFPEIMTGPLLCI